MKRVAIWGCLRSSLKISIATRKRTWPLVLLRWFDSTAFWKFCVAAGYGESIYCKSTIYFRRHNIIMVYLLNFNIIYTIILATCFDSYESSSGLNFKNCCNIVLQFFCLTVFVCKTYIIILATCFDSYESFQALISRAVVHIVLQFFVLQFLSYRQKL
jgi:hypothetical protein